MKNIHPHELKKYAVWTVKISMTVLISPHHWQYTLAIIPYTLVIIAYTLAIIAYTLAIIKYTLVIMTSA